MNDVNMDMEQGGQIEIEENKVDDELLSHEENFEEDGLQLEDYETEMYGTLKRKNPLIKPDVSFIQQFVNGVRQKKRIEFDSAEYFRNKEKNKHK